jgi:hypothetical protein
MARQLHAKGEMVALLFIIDSLSPGTDLKHAPPGDISSSDNEDTAIVRLRNVFFRLKAHDMPKYVAVRVKSELENRLSRAIKIYKEILIKIYLRIGGRLPFCVRNQYILKIYYDAIATYTPKPYAGACDLHQVCGAIRLSGIPLEQTDAGRHGSLRGTCVQSHGHHKRESRRSVGREAKNMSHAIAGTY